MATTDPDLQLPPELRPPRRRRGRLLVGAAVVLVLGAAVLAFGVFEVHTLFIDEEVAEAGPVFESGAVALDGAADPAAPADDPGPGPEPEEGGAPTAPAPTTPAAPEVTTVGTGTFVDRGHPGEGTATVLTDGTQTFVRFEEDFATDNGPDLRVRAVVDGERIDLGALKGNIGAQNYELPRDVDPTTVTEVDVWCRRFDYVFTDAALTP